MPINKKNSYPRIVNFTKKEFDAVWELAEEKGLGQKGFSAAVRMIIREWMKYVRDRGREES
jgi:hypothetical protein